MEDSSKIIIRRRKKKSHEAHHGGSWKVAYADFVTAMMAFFLLLWLLSMTAPETKAALSQYFESFSIIKSASQQSGTSILDKSTGVLEIVRKTQKASFRMKKEERATSEELAAMMRMAIDEKLQAMKKQVLIDTTPEGLRIQIVDNEGSEIFRLGSDVPTEKAVQIIRLVSENIREQPNRIVIEGHTDSAPFKTVQKTNWELSTSRASAARRELENNGVDPGRIARVVGYADQELLVREDPKDPRNRRISIILLQ
ncbi:MAG: chemotaxis protein [Deltaproteobacteria bacterium]|nr:MAG: chemotaxis protein [Deltaproteobacteria bacterium]